MQIFSEHSWGWLLLIFPLAFAIAYLKYLYKKKQSTFSKSQKQILFLLHFLLLSILGILLLDLYSRFYKNEYIKPVLIVAIDNSRSMISAKDSNEVKNFFKNTFTHYIQTFKDKMDVQILSFGDHLQFNPDSIRFHDFKTNAENIFSYPATILGNKPISTMLLISDGIFNDGIHPVSLAENIDFPVYVLGTSDTTAYRDLAIKNVLHNKQVYIGNDFIIEVLLQSKDIKNEKIKISISENNQEISAKEIIVNSEAQNLISLPFQLPANKAGTHTYKIKSTILKDEKNTKNNEFYFTINVIENKIKVLILYTAPHPDISAIRQTLNTSLQYDVQVFQENSFNKNIKEYDVVLYHSPNNNSLWFNKCIQLNIPMMIITTHLTPLQNTLLKINQYIPTQMNEIETQFKKTFSSFSLNEEYTTIESQLPVILAPYGNYSPLGEYEILCHQKINTIFTELPLFYFTQTLANKYAVFLGDGLWRWKMLNYQKNQNTEWFNHLIHSTFHYLSLKKDKRPFKVFVPANIHENEPLQVTAELLNETMQPITDPDVLFTLKDSTKKEYKFVFNKSANNYYLNAGILSAGEYTYKASTQYKGKELTQSGKIHILPYSIEQNNLTAQHTALKILANKTKGKFYLLPQHEQLKNDLLNNPEIKTIVVENETFQYWIENKYWLILIILLSLTEWIIRRWNGII